MDKKRAKQLSKILQSGADKTLLRLYKLLLISILEEKCFGLCGRLFILEDEGVISLGQRQQVIDDIYANVSYKDSQIYYPYFWSIYDSESRQEFVEQRIEELEK